jgi:hypothetical protein
MASTGYAAGLSGTAYVPVYPRDEDPGTLSAIRIHAPSRCDHSEFICTECAHQWEWDWVVCYRRTAGGRALDAQSHGQRR